MDSLVNLKDHQNRQWQRQWLNRYAMVWFKNMAKRLRTAGPRSPWWPYTADFHQSLGQVIDDAINGNYQLKSETTSSRDEGFIKGEHRGAPP